MLQQFADQQYLNLETYRQNGQAMRTPVWFVEDNGVLYVHTVKNAGKIKRIRRIARVRIAPCDITGAVKGEWIDAEARVLDEAGMTRANELLDRKYGEAMAQFKQRNNLQNVAWDAIEIRV
ncbi:MAG TPA: PPOX class F420-dependent oxidoreductase [Anaerolineae bacterium]|nr:PPOX class F420-dependent oxidoreductase [Anaerolineae bacterium]